MKSLTPKPWVVTSVKLLTGLLLSLCALLIVLVLSAHDKRIKALENIPTVVTLVTPTSTPVPTASPTAVLKRVVLTPVTTSK